ncbi:MAG: 3-oxoadipate enol-lactonase [Myxococcota bacterium]
MEASIGGARLRFQLEGNEAGPVVVLSHSLGSHRGIWDPQVPVFGRHLRVLRYDTRGHGGSAVPLGPYRLDEMAEDVRGLLDALRIERAAFVGISMGGMIGQALALQHPDRLHALVLCDTTSEIPEAARPMWEERIRVTREQGMEPHVEPTVQRWFTEPFRRAHPEVVDRVRGMIRDTDPEGYVACCHAIEELQLTERLAEIRVPTLVVAGAEDPATTPGVARGLHDRIEGSELSVLESASHLCNMEQPEAFNRAVGDFLERHLPVS